MRIFSSFSWDIFSHMTRLDHAEPKHFMDYDMFMEWKRNVFLFSLIPVLKHLNPIPLY